MRNATLVIAAALAAAGCRTNETKPAAAPPAAATAAPAPVPAPAPAAPAPWEADNPVQPLPAMPLGVNGDFASLSFKVTPEKVRLGRWLFFDKRVSADGTVSCATCHRPENAFSEPTPHSTGVGGKEGQRKAPTFLNGAFAIYPVYFWDGRAASLAEQAKGPMANPIEMANTHEGVTKAVSAVPGYQKEFAAVYGDDKIDIDRIADAIAAYEATRLDGDSKYDRFENGDKSALTAQEQKGLDLFLGKARCAECHITGASFTDSKFHNLGVGWEAKKAKGKAGHAAIAAMSDVGRYGVTKADEDVGAFKTPTLRDVSKHAPYMHDGSVKTLHDVVEHYNKGGNKNPWLDKAIVPLKLTKVEVNALVAFMEALDGTGWQDTAPASFPQ